MSIIRKRFLKGVELIPEDLSSQDLSREGELAYDSNDDKLKYRNASETKEVVNTNESQTLENKTIDASSTGNNSITIDSDSAKYNDTIETVISLLKSDGLTPVENLQEAVDAIKRALDNQNDASEIGYDATASGLDTGNDSSNVQDAIDDLDANVDDLVTLSGVAENSTNLGAFTGSTITDDQDIKSALQEVETAIEARALGTDLQDHINATAAHGVGEVVGTSEAQELSNKEIKDPTRLDVKKDLLADLETYALTASDGQIVFATDEQEMFQVINGELQPIGGGGSTQFEISQVAHGFVVGDGIYHNGTSWVKGQADDADTLAYYVVIERKSDDVFIAADFGRVVDIQLGDNSAYSLVAGNYYFLSDTVAGQPTSTEPSSFSNPLFYVESIDDSDINNQVAVLQIKCLRPEVVGADTNLDNLSDVSASTPSNGDILVYDSTSQLYILESRNLKQTQSINNNASVAVNITNLLLDGTSHKGYKIAYNIHRITDTNEVSQTGTLHFAYKTTTATWQFSENFAGDDAGVTFEIDSTGQVKYTSTDLTGTGYSAIITYRIQEEL